MTKSNWLINVNKTEVKRFIRIDKCIDGVGFVVYFFDTGKMVDFLKKTSEITTTVSVNIDLARKIYEILLFQKWSKTKEVWI